MRSVSALPPLFLLLLPSLLGCSPAVELTDPSPSEGPEVRDAEEFLERDDDAYRELIDRCGCSGDVYDASGWRLQFLSPDLEAMALVMDGSCAQEILEQLESPGCEVEGPLPECRVFVGEREVGES